MQGEDPLIVASVGSLESAMHALIPNPTMSSIQVEGEE